MTAPHALHTPGTTPAPGAIERPRVAVVVRWGAIRGADPRAVAQLDGHLPRWVSIARAAQRTCDVRVFVLVDDPEAPLPDVGLPMTALSLAMPAGSPRDRLVRVARRLGGPRVLAADRRALTAALRDWGCTAAFVLTWRNRDIAAGVADLVPTALFAEESIPDGEDGWGRTTIAPLVKVEVGSLRWALRHVREVVVISPIEVAWGREMFRKRVRVIPHTVDPADWKPAEAPTPREGVFVIGNFGRPNNAEGLREVLAAMAGRSDAPDIRLASGTPPHAMLDGYEHLVSLGAVADPLPWYHRSAATLVPARAVRGAKTTILQAWAAGCPVVTTPESAASVGARDGVDALVGADAGAIADLLVRVSRDRALQQGLRAEGLRTMRERFGPAAIQEAVDRLLADLLPNPPAGLLPSVFADPNPSAAPEES